MTCRLCGTKLIEEEFARLCPKRDGSEDGQWHDSWEKVGDQWVDDTPVKTSDRFAALEARLAQAEARLTSAEARLTQGGLGGSPKR